MVRVNYGRTDELAELADELEIPTRIHVDSVQKDKKAIKHIPSSCFLLEYSACTLYVLVSVSVCAFSFLLYFWKKAAPLF